MANASGCCARLDDDRHAAVFGELDRVAGEIEQNLAQPRRVADDLRRQALVDIAADFQAFGLRAGPEQLDRLLDQAASANGRAARSSRPASILEKSRTSSISDNSVSPDVFTAFR